jgi:hypothetical protein
MIGCRSGGTGIKGKMSSRQSAPTAPPSSGDGGRGRVHIRSIEEMAPKRDEELAVIFREMRRALGVSREQIAGRLATPVTTVEALEHGALSDLPDWPEVSRIVTTYASQLGLDSRPILRRLEGQISPRGNGTAEPAPAGARKDSAKKAHQPPPVSGTGPPIPPAAAVQTRSPTAESPLPRPPEAQPPPETEPEMRARPQLEPEPKPEPVSDAEMREAEAPKAVLAAAKKVATDRARQLLRGLFHWLLLIGFVGVLGLGVWYAAKNPRQVWTALDSLPDPVPWMMRSAWEFVRPLENGSSGVDVADPEKRKSNKLP